MKCPYCEREMKKGYFIDREAPIQWIPEGSKPGLQNRHRPSGNRFITRDTSFSDEHCSPLHFFF